NGRETKQATSAIYILKRIRIPAVLVECGFLSNAEERALLETPEYRLKVAAVLFASTGEYLQIQEKGR
ncbi:MAG: N-acetylmuramoyl-L-alanine amidase, partial [Clostridia bacterium]|nr:N-acetylmuramoyl-L-alanine amidase [Clostridia bacterium]